MTSADSLQIDDDDDDDIQKSTRASLQDGPYACKPLHKLSGGSANFVYRGVLNDALPDGSTTVIVKHSAPFLATKRTFALNIDRCIFEYKVISALQRLSPTLCSGMTVKTPKALSFSESNTTAIYDDFTSSIDLKSYLLTQHLTHSQASVLGNALGLWTKDLHQWGAESDQDELKIVMKGNHVMKELKFNANFMRIITKIEEYPQILRDSRDAFEAIAMDTKTIFDSTDGILIHGDFWTGNVLLKNEPFINMQGESVKLIIVDWELSHINSFVFDLGQMFAELYQVKHFKKIEAGVWIIAAFMQGYGKLEEKDAFKVAIHVGTHFIAWGSSTPGWGTKEQVIELVTMGRDLILNGWKSNRDYFKETPLWCLFE